MNRTIFYSWQSDLPNSTNRSFIESVIEKVISDFKKTKPLTIDFILDMDTRKTPGTPDITETIFKKINNTSLFVADVSIINPQSKYRKTPNPNVLIELGYAVKSIGWDRIVCVYNSDYGTLKDLPFDLRHRRPLLYSLSGQNKKVVKDNIATNISKTIENLHQNGLLFNEIQDRLKKDVDTQILTLINWLSKIVFGYSEDNNIMMRAGNFLNLQEEDIDKKISDTKFLGFQILKNFEEVEVKLNILLDKVISSSYFQSNIAKVIVNIIDWIGCFDAYTKPRSTPDLFIDIGEIAEGYEIISGQELNPNDNSNFPNRYLLLSKLNNGEGKVLDFGDITEKLKAEKLLHVFILKTEYKHNYIQHIFRFIKLVNEWLDLTNGEFILDTYKNFEMKFPPKKRGDS